MLANSLLLWIFFSSSNYFVHRRTSPGLSLWKSI